MQSRLLLVVAVALMILVAGCVMHKGPTVEEPGDEVNAPDHRFRGHFAAGTAEEVVHEHRFHVPDGVLEIRFQGRVALDADLEMKVTHAGDTVATSTTPADPENLVQRVAFGVSDVSAGPHSLRLASTGNGTYTVEAFLCEAGDARTAC